mgnify:CR=1 FL=1
MTDRADPGAAPTPAARDGRRRRTVRAASRSPGSPRSSWGSASTRESAPAAWRTSRLKQATDEAARHRRERGDLRSRATPIAGDPACPASTQAFTDAPIFARTSGYVKRWYFDIGARVKQGQLLAEIDSPEVDQQLQQARADLETAQANLRQAKITADRWQALLGQRLGVQAGDGPGGQRAERDEGHRGLECRERPAARAAAGLREDLRARSTAIITARNTDIGVLIDAGARTTAARELFHMAAIQRAPGVRRRPEIYSRAAAHRRVRDA